MIKVVKYLTKWEERFDSTSREEVTRRPSSLTIVIQELWSCPQGTVTRLEVQETQGRTMAISELQIH